MGLVAVDPVVVVVVKHHRDYENVISEVKNEDGAN